MLFGNAVLPRRSHASCNARYPISFLFPLQQHWGQQASPQPQTLPLTVILSWFPPCARQMLVSALAPLP